MNKPDWLNKGNWIEFAFSIGRIVDVLESPARVMLLVESPKGIWRNHPAEWIEFQPDAVKVAEPERVRKEFDAARRQLQRMNGELENLEHEFTAGALPDFIMDRQLERSA